MNKIRWFQSSFILLFYLVIATGSGESKKIKTDKQENLIHKGTNLSEPAQNPIVILPDWVYGVYSGIAPAYDLLDEQGKPVNVFGERVKIPSIKRDIQIDKGSNQISLRATSSDGSFYLSTAKINVLEQSSARVVIDTQFDNGSDGTPTRIIITHNNIEFNESKQPASNLTKNK